MYILGLSSFYHDSAAALIKDGNLLSAAQEERFTRKKGDGSLPVNAIAFCLKSAGIKIGDIDRVVYYENSMKKLSRLLATYLCHAPRGYQSYKRAMKSFLSNRLNAAEYIRESIGYDGEVASLEHHLSHAAAAFLPSPFRRAAILTMDGVGEWATTTIGEGSGNQLRLLREMRFPHSLGMLYSAFTHYCGFKVNSGEYKLMGLAPYGEPKYAQLILDEIIDLKNDGSFEMNMAYFDYCTGFTMTSEKFNEAFGGPPRLPESPIASKDADIARSIQVVLEEIVLRLAKTSQELTGADYLCMAGGVALNCVANGKLLKKGLFKDIWIQPAAGDSGGAIGAAFYDWFCEQGHTRQVDGRHDLQHASYLGPSYSTEEIQQFLDANSIPYEVSDRGSLPGKVAAMIADQKVVGLFHGRMEFGPRALGNRSIIGDPRSNTMQSEMNLKIKFRESFRPFAPAVLVDRARDYFDFPETASSPYMLFVADVLPDHRRELDPDRERPSGLEKLNIDRSTIPAVTHVDYSARLQTVSSETNPLFAEVIEEFDKMTGCGMVINTSFNVRGEPIVCTYVEAYRCFMRTEIDYLVMENCIIEKSKQRRMLNDVDWKEEFRLD